MVKIGALIGAFFTTIGGFLRIIALASIINDDYGHAWENVLDTVSFLSGNTTFLGVFSTLLYFFGIMLVLGSGFIKGTLFLKIGGRVMILGLLIVMIAWFTGGLYQPLYRIAGIIMFLGIILYFIGCIQFRKNNIVTIFTGFLLLISILLSQIVIANILMPISNLDDSIEILFISLIFQTILFIIHSWVFGFSKKQVEHSDKVEDNLSIESGQAFTSYVSDNMKKKKKDKKPLESDEISFTF